MVILIINVLGNVYINIFSYKVNACFMYSNLTLKALLVVHKIEYARQRKYCPHDDDEQNGRNAPSSNFVYDANLVTAKLFSTA